MKHHIPSVLLLAIILTSCEPSAEPSGSNVDQTSSANSSDTSQLLQLVRHVYEWHETTSSQNDFDPIPDKKDDKYIGINPDQHAQRMSELKQTGLFADEFLENYNHIASAIDSALKNNTMEWFAGDIPPFGNDLNPWCNCQENPDNYWKTLTIRNVVIDHDSAEFIWTWGEDFEYYVRAIREGDDWKIAYMEGFNFDKYLPAN